MKHKLLLSIMLIYVVMSAGLRYQLGARIVPADLVMVLLMMFVVVGSGHRGAIQFSKIYVAALPLFMVFFLGAIFARYPDRVVVELIIISFGYLGSLTLANLLCANGENFFQKFCTGYVIAIGLVSLVSLLDFLVLPGILGPTSFGGLSGTFRNTGQAGSFFGVNAVICCALLLSGLAPRRPLYILCAVICVFALIATLKRAAVIGFFAGFSIIVFQLFMSRSRSDKKLGAVFISISLVVMILGATTFFWALENVEGMLWRYSYKFSSTAIDDFADGFLADNIEATLSALADRPLIGVGLDNVRLVYFINEIHSTYLGILAYSGIIGIILYFYFIGTVASTAFGGRHAKLQNKYAAFLYYLFPLFLGLMLSWAYTYHIRKREFWMLLAFIAAARFFSHAAQSRTRSLSVAASMPKAERSEESRPWA